MQLTKTGICIKCGYHKDLMENDTCLDCARFCKVCSCYIPGIFTGRDKHKAVCCSQRCRNREAKFLARMSVLRGIYKSEHLNRLASEMEYFAGLARSAEAASRLNKNKTTKGTRQVSN